MRTAPPRIPPTDIDLSPVEILELAFAGPGKVLRTADPPPCTASDCPAHAPWREP